ncbi:MAG: ABC transporter ATP-binding protein [Synergistaceae bacterium]|nr:ABC transporter ATP-binding protein [Synergistaceae bacterium]
MYGRHERPAYIELRGVTKNFGGVRANDGVDLSVHRGEIHALLGENGSGKTTLMNILTGIYAQDSGEVFMDGRRVRFRTPRDSIEAGIGMICQHANLVDAFSVEENIAAGAERGLWVNKRKLRAKIGKIAECYRLAVRPERKIHSLSMSEKQTVEILKTLYRGVTTLVLDEPTSALTPLETEALFANLRRMRESGCAVVLITHKLNDVFEISDRVTVLRKGKSVYTALAGDTDCAELTENMVGQAVSLDIPRTESLGRDAGGSPLLEIRGLVVKGAYGRALNGVSLRVEVGEIHGIAGVAGSGQRELCDAVAGLGRIVSGDVLLNGRAIGGMTPGQMRKSGIKIGYVPEDRMEMGLVGGMSIADNVLLRGAGSRRIFFDARDAGALARKIIEKYDINAPDTSEPVKNLSGGNIQKVLLGREIEMKPDLLITAYPVRGLDVGASDYIFRLLNREKESGMGVLFIGEDLDILLGLCDRVSVMRAGRLAATLDARKTSKTEIGALMTGNDSDEGTGP